ncbi:MAG: hypothetical protein OXB84_01400, partial [Halobacteriovoraceae bacterium]|nr:hypothetical protein [Halobacteriovoraceae bacterium]
LIGNKKKGFKMKFPHAVKIEKIERHPKSARLKICRVNNGTETVQVVCGAKNVKLHMMTIHAPIGSKMPSGMEIKEADFQGEVSRGMLCSAKDLGISQELGIIELPSSIKQGTPLSQIGGEYLSSIPWYSFDEVDSLWEDPDKKIHVWRKGETVDYGKKNFKLLSKTYFNGEKYLYRHFNN